VKLRDHDFTTRQHSRTVPEAIESNAAIAELAFELFHELREQRRVASRLLGVGLSGLSRSGAHEQLGLFEDAIGRETERDRHVSRVVDELQERFGYGAVVPGGTMGQAARPRTPGDALDADA
jgi:hypothetical protein